MSYLGDFPVDGVVYIPFHTFNSSGASVTLTGLAVTDIEIYKDGSATQRASEAGYTLLDTDGIDFDGITGIHGFKVDLSDNTDAGFYAAGHEYMVIVSSVTIDSQTVNFVAAEFSIERAGGVLALLKNGTYGLSAIESLVDDIGTAGAGLTAVPWNAAWDAEVQSEVADALNAYDPPTNAEMEARTLVAANYFDPAADEVIANVAKISGDTAAADNLEAMLDGTGGVDVDLKQLHLAGAAGPGLLITSSAVGGGAVKIESTAPVSGIGIDIDAAGGSGIGIDIDAATYGIDTTAVAGVGLYANGGASGVGIGATGATGINAAGTANDIFGDLTGSVASVATDGITAASLKADAITEIQAGLALQTSVDDLETRLTATRAGYLDNLSAGAVALETTAQSILTDTGTDIPASITTIDDFLDTEVAAILADTNELQVDWVNGGRLDLLVDGIKAKTDNLPSDPADQSAVEAAISALNNLSAAQVNAEVVDALNVDTYAEPGQGAPAATASLAAKIGYLYKTWRNKKTQTATTRSIYNDAGDTVDQKGTDSDDGTTYTKGEIGGGP